MANSPAHKFGQIIGDLLEEIMAPQLEEFCQGRNLYLDKKGDRGNARSGKKVTWVDKYGNSHDLDFVIEKGGDQDTRGRPLAFIEAAWRRYTKHSKNKAQEIQGAVLPIAEKYDWDKPFLGAILAGVFTSNSLNQMRSSGFEVALFPYETIVEAFASSGIDVNFDEETHDSLFSATILQIESLSPTDRISLKNNLINLNRVHIDNFLMELQATLDRQILQIVVIPLHGIQNGFATTNEAIEYVTSYSESSYESGVFMKYEVIIKYNNNDKIEASFSSKSSLIKFLQYIEEGQS